MSVKSAGKFLFVLFLFALFLGPGFYSSSSATAQSDGSFNIRADVELVAVEVIALDKQGKPLSNLKKEDFRLLEDGKKQEILSFDEVSGKSGISAIGRSPLNEGGLPRGKTVLIIFDDGSIPAEYTKTARESADSFVKKHMQSQDLFAVASYSTSMRILQNLTNDQDKVLKAIAQPISALRSSWNFGDLLRSLEQINYSTANLKGRKSVLIYAALSAYSPTGSFSSGSLDATYRNALASAGKSNTVIYTIDPGGTYRQAIMDPAGGDRSKVGGANVDRTSGMMGQASPDNQIYRSTATGAASSSPSIATSGLPSTPSGAGIDSSSAPAASSGLSSTSPSTLNLFSFTAGSGGYSVFDTDNLDFELDRLDQQISNYYILGFQSGNPKHDGSFRKLQIKTELKGVTLKYRDGYWDRRPVDVLASSRQEKTLMTALASPSTAAKLPIAFQPAYFYDSPKTARVLVETRISTVNIAFKKKGGQLETDLNIMGVAYGEDGSTAARFSEPVPVSIDKDQESEFRKKDFTYRNYFRLKPGKYRLKLAASDESNNLGALEQSLEIPAFPEKGLAGSSIVLAEQALNLPELIQNLQTQLLDESNPLLYSGMQIEPRADNKLPVNAAIPILFRMYNLSGSAELWDLVANPKLVNEKGEALDLSPVLLKKVIAPVADGQGVVYFSLPVKDVAPGKYHLILKIANTTSTETATLQTDIEFVK
jgi:VWFA-related protein